MAIRETSIDDLAAARNAGEVTVIDVRNADEYAAGHIPGARLIPLPELADHVDELPPDRAVHVVCQSGGRSARGAELLDAHGIHAVSVTGGTKAWIVSGHPTDTA